MTTRAGVMRRVLIALVLATGVAHAAPSEALRDAARVALEGIATTQRAIRTVELGGGSTFEIIGTQQDFARLEIEIDYGVDPADVDAYAIGHVVGEIRRLAVERMYKARRPVALEVASRPGGFTLTVMDEHALLGKHGPQILALATAATASADLVTTGIAGGRWHIDPFFTDLGVDDGIDGILYADAAAWETTPVGVLFERAQKLAPARIAKQLATRAGHVRIRARGFAAPVTAKLVTAARSALRGWKLRGPRALAPRPIAKRDGAVARTSKHSASSFAQLVQIYDLPDERTALALVSGLAGYAPESGGGKPWSISYTTLRTGARVELRIGVWPSASEHLETAISRARDGLRALRAKPPSDEDVARDLHWQIDALNPLDGTDRPELAELKGPRLADRPKLVTALLELPHAAVVAAIDRYVDPDKLLAIRFTH